MGIGTGDMTAALGRAVSYMSYFVSFLKKAQLVNIKHLEGALGKSVKHCSLATVRLDE